LKNKKQSNGSLKVIGRILATIIIILIGLISFVGIYMNDKNAMKNLIPEYQLGYDVYGSRHISISVDDSTKTKKYDSEGKLVENTDESTDKNSDENANENITEVEEPVNPEEVRTVENYKAVRDIIEARLEYLKIDGYLLRFDEDTGKIDLEIPENTNTDYLAQYSITKGVFKVADNDTSEVLLSNENLKRARVQYTTGTSGTTVYLTIEFNDEGTQKLKDISNTYVSSKDSDGNTTTKKIKMTIDDSTIISTYFQEQITDGIIQLSLGTSTNSSDIQTYLQEASNMAVLLNTDPMPITYKMDVNRFVYSDITPEMLKVVIIALCVIAGIMAIIMIIKFKKNGFMGVIANIGFVAILLLAIRYGNVTLTLTGIIAIAIAEIIEYCITMLILREYANKCEPDILKKNIRRLLGNIAVVLTPITVMAITFALISWEEISSFGMVLFWAIIIMIVYNVLMLVIQFFSPKSDKKIKNKKSVKTDKKSKKEDK